MSTDLPAFRRRVFLCGADMQPGRIRARWPEARFVAIARADGVVAAGLGLGWYGLGPDVWGIVVETGEIQRGTMLPLRLADGTHVTAMTDGDPAGFGSPTEALAQARYWELPADYRDRLEQVVAAG